MLESIQGGQKGESSG